MKKNKVIHTLLSAIMLTSLFLAGCSGSDNNSSEGNGESSGGGDEVTIRFSWWGDTKRNEIYNSIIDRFEEANPTIKVDREFGGWNDYWDRLSTQIAGGNAPDVVSMHQFYVSDYARRNALLNMQEFADAGTIDLSNFAEATVESGTVDGNLFMVAKGVTMPGIVYNAGFLEEIGVEPPDMNWTWDEFNEKMLEVNQAMPEENFGVPDLSGGQLQPNFRYFVRQRGNDVFTEDGMLGFEREDLVAWWTMWEDLRQKGAVPDGATTTEYDSAPLEQNMFTTGLTAFTQVPANQLHLYQEQFDNGDLEIVRMPGLEDGETGEYIEGAYLSITERSEHPEEAAKFIDFFVNTEEALELFKVEQGSPGSSEMAEFVLPLLEPAQQRAVDFIQETVEYARPAPYAPLGINELEQSFADNASGIAFGQLTVEEAADNFMAAAESILQ
ncbi:ABC transporter substrate-binding protein [Jeotgalibacillus proteolyticus]|uniref:Sugar-binding protein n=1 Tax=Jeotgalibacillus proteolyticus TaxID=2082395 RepID=A0A2S5GBP0_9BACL|nr:sugar ABC transporter substrate-binding protein [Jeotgalibacillus proteolyticus]PPA70409.1 sugar-binding protein [Jeotgalibacillus proteolyticus]